jgi:hypothetical protein
MKKLTILLAFAILAFTSCTKDNLVSNGSTPASGTFSIDNVVYNIERTYIVNNFINAEMGDINKVVEINVTYTNDSTSDYSADIVKSGGSSSIIYYNSYYRSTNNSKIVKSDKSNIKTTKNANGSYTVKGTIYMYENSDSTKRVTVGANFTTF